MSRIIFHVDVNSAFLSWEAARRVRNGLPDLRDIPSIIGGDPKQRTSIVLAKSMPAKKYGIVTGEPVSAALRKCPHLVAAPSDFKLYVENSRAFKNICREYSPSVEEFSIDECFIDMTGTRLLHPDPVKTAAELKDRIHRELGFTVNIGIGENKLTAKMASDFQKPDRVHTLFPDEIKNKLWPLPVRELFLCGRASAEKLEHFSIMTIGDLASADLGLIQSLLGKKLGKQLREYANGIDDSPVLAVPEAPKGYSNETTLEDDVVTADKGFKVLLSLSDSVASRIRRDGVKAGCVSVTIRGNDMKRHSHQKNLPSPTDVTNEIFEVSKELFSALWDGRMPIRLIGLSLTNLDRGEEQQLSLFSDGRREKEARADRAADAIRERFGRSMIKRGGTMDGAFDVGKKHRGIEEADRGV